MGLSSLEASKRLDVSEYKNWNALSRLYMNVEKAYRDFREEPVDTPWDFIGTFDAIYDTAKVKRVKDRILVNLRLLFCF